MLETKFLYSIILLLSIIGPIFYSFERKIHYVKFWISSLLASALMMVVFIPWDIWFTGESIWWFNDAYMSGVKIFLLPIEEWLFFLAIPFACIFLYEALNHHAKSNFLDPHTWRIAKVLLMLCLILLLIFSSQKYTAISASLAAFVTALSIFYKPHWMGNFLRMYLVSLIPFILVNGTLTGAFTEEAAVNYNEDEIMGPRLITIPIEDAIYGFTMLLSSVWFYELINKFRFQKGQSL